MFLFVVVDFYTLNKLVYNGWSKLFHDRLYRKNTSKTPDFSLSF